MKVSERLAAIDKIAAELQAKYTFVDIDAYFAVLNIPTPDSHGSSGSKRQYAKDILSRLPLDTIGRIADDLGLGALAHVSAQANPPALWRGNSDFRLFLSHISKDKNIATRLRDCLKQHGIAAFVAHEDINPTLEWQSEIERGLFSMEALVAIHTPGFSKSHWTQQEVGFALGRGVKVISFRMGEDPVGFISKKQALSRQQKTAEQIASELDDLLAGDEATASRLSEARRARGIFEDGDIPF